MVRAPLTAEIPADRRSLLEYLQIASILCIEHAFPVAQAAKKGASGLLAQHVSVGQAPSADRAFDDGREGARDTAEEPVASIDQFSWDIARLLPVGRRGRLRQRQPRR
jgi:hypothetical protein